MLCEVMDMPPTPESVTGETGQQHEMSIAASPRRRLLRKTSSSCAPVSADAGGPSVLPPGEEVWRRFTPSVIDPLSCLARTYNAGAGGQCKRKPRDGEVTCGVCKTPVHGRVDGPIPEVKLAAFLRAANKNA